MKIVIIGGGTAGVWTALHYGYYTRNDENIEVELIHNPKIDSFPVGQATTINVPELLWYACGTDWYHNEIRATPKLGILYENFSKKNPNIFHPFQFYGIAFQADPKYLQKYILKSELFTVKEENVTDLDMVDADVIFDCRGNIGKDDIEYETLYCPVNSVLLAVGPSPAKPQLWSRHVATPDGWTFVIPNTTDTTSGGMYLAPTPDANYKFRIYYNKMPTGLGSGSTGNSDTYLSTYFPQGLLYACLVEAFAFLKGPMEMLTLYENKYKSSIQQFAGMQLGRRRRDDYTDGTVRIPVKSPSP